MTTTVAPVPVKAPGFLAAAPLPSMPDFIPGAPPPATLWADTWRGIAKENPVLVQMLGMCPTMAVTNVLANGIAMGVATTFVLVGSGLFVSLLRNYIAHEVRITSYILIIATFVTLADLLLAASFPEISKALGPFIPLIVANCLLLGLDILGPRWEPWVFMVLPAGGFFTLGLLLITAAWIDEFRRKRRMMVAR